MNIASAYSHAAGRIESLAVLANVLALGTYNLVKHGSSGTVRDP